MNPFILASLVSVAVRAFCMAPCDLTITLKVEPAKNNLKVELKLESEDSDFSRSSEIDLTSGLDPKTTLITYQHVPQGHYKLSVVLWKHEGETWVAGTDSKVVEVIGTQIKGKR